MTWLRNLWHRLDSIGSWRVYRKETVYFNGRKLDEAEVKRLGDALDDFHREFSAVFDRFSERVKKETAAKRRDT